MLYDSCMVVAGRGRACLGPRSAAVIQYISAVRATHFDVAAAVGTQYNRPTTAPFYFSQRLVS